MKLPRQNPLKHISAFLEHITTFAPFEKANNFRKLLESFKLKDLRFLANEARERLGDDPDEGEIRWLNLIFDTFLSKIYVPNQKKKVKKCPKYMFPIQYHNKGFDFINLASILRDNDVINTLPNHLQLDDVPSVVYRLEDTIRNKIFNYKKTVSEIDINDTISYGSGLPSCNCHSSSFKDTHHNHIVTGDLRFIENNDLRRLLSKGPNYREPRSINWNKCLEIIKVGVSICSSSMGSGSNGIDLTTWENKIVEKVSQKIEVLKTKTTPRKTNPILKRESVQHYLEKLHREFVLVPIDKAANNIAIICKRHYIEVILKEIGHLGEEGNNTYVKSGREASEIISENNEYTSRLKFQTEEDDNILPVMYWTPKMHKTPIGKRFIIASKKCSTKKISKAVSSIFKLIYNQILNFHKNAKFLSNYNKFWVLQNVDPVLEKLKAINKRKNAKSIATYDFSTLYTSIPHNDLIEKLSRLVSFVFEGGDSKYISVSDKFHASWSKRNYENPCFSERGVKIAVKHLILNCYITVGKPF